MTETKWNATTLHGLLTDTDRHLRNVESISAFVIPKIDAFARVAYNTSYPGIGCWSVSNEFLKVGDVVWRD